MGKWERTVAVKTLHMRIYQVTHDYETPQPPNSPLLSYVHPAVLTYAVGQWGHTVAVNAAASYPTCVDRQDAHY